MSRAKSIAGEWAVVTGASSGIGLEFSRQLAAKGCNLLMISNQEDALNAAAAEIAEQAGVKTQALFLDLTAPDAHEIIATKLDDMAIVPMILINNAGIFDFKAIEKMSERRINLHIDLHMRAVTMLCRTIGHRMAEAGRGYILNMSSMACWMPMPGLAMYSATKAYIRAFSRAFRVEMLEHGVSVTVACPGGIATDLYGLPRNLQKVGVGVGALTTVKRFVKHAINRMLRRKAQYINGLLNRITIVFVASLPGWARTQVKRQILDRLSHD